MSFQHYEAASVIAARRRAKEEDAEHKEQAYEAKARADALTAKYREMDEAARRTEALVRAQSEQARRAHEEIERLAQGRADDIERNESIEQRARSILAEREALLDPQTASAYDIHRPPRGEGDQPSMTFP